MPGLMQTFDVSSDTLEQLDLALGLVFPWNRRGADFYRVGEAGGFAWLELWPYKVDGKTDILPLPFPLNTREKMFGFVRDWLSSAKRGQKFDTDGSCREGWRISQNHSCWEPYIAKVEATWIIYGK